MKPLVAVLVQPEGDSLYAAQPKIYPREMSGRFTTLRTAAVFLLLGIFYLIPWVRWDGHQAVLFDLPARKFYVFGLTFWPQDFFWLTCLLIIAGLSLFFFTALAGRLWCGYACPQTVWTEVFLWIERACEGRRNQRIKLDNGGWTREKLLRKSTKQFLWVTLSLWTGFTFVGFFTPIATLGHEIASASLGGWESFWIVFYAFATYGNAGFLREQVCKYMCPYARFQSAMFDRDTLVVSYDVARGEPRGSRSRSAPYVAMGLGSCVDCDACVQVCPTGIDIRKGLQIECIACAACIDACDAVMDKMQYPRGLIRYTTENILDGGKRRILRPRITIYAGLLLALIATFGWGISHRGALIIEILRDRNALFREASDGSIENSYTLKLVNKSQALQHFHLTVDAASSAQIVGRSTIELASGEVGSLPLTLRAPQATAGGMHAVVLKVGNDDGTVAGTQTAQFFTPEKK
jgi:cytochrome c oxidase accessory protein FixG